MAFIGVVGGSFPSLFTRRNTCRASFDRPERNRDARPDSRSTRQIEDFLTQRSIQTLLFYFDQCRDEVSFQYLEDFEDHEGIFGYHGFYGLRVPWDNYLKDMLKTPSLTVTVRQPYFRRGGSKDNPYLPPKYREYEMAIDPRKIAERLLEVRAHLATEMSMDLSLTRKENAELKRHHFEMVRNQEDKIAGLMFPAREEEVLYHANSPFRGGSYDLLKKFSIYISTLRVLERMERDYKQRDTHRFLSNFFESQAERFKTEQKYHIGEDFINSLWNEGPLLRKNRGGSMNLIDPDSIVEIILRERVRVAEEWIFALGNVPKENARLLSSA